MNVCDDVEQGAGSYKCVTAGSGSVHELQNGDGSIQDMATEVKREMKRYNMQERET